MKKLYRGPADADRRSPRKLISAAAFQALPVNRNLPRIRPQRISRRCRTSSLCARCFAYTGYWLNNPPGANANTWQGKRRTIQRAGFGFLLLFNGRADAELKSAPNPGASDGAAAARAAKAEGFRAAA